MPFDVLVFVGYHRLIRFSIIWLLIGEELYLSGGFQGCGSTKLFIYWSHLNWKKINTLIKSYTMQTWCHIDTTRQVWIIDESNWYDRNISTSSWMKLIIYTHRNDVVMAKDERAEWTNRRCALINSEKQQIQSSAFTDQYKFVIENANASHLRRSRIQ